MSEGTSASAIRAEGAGSLDAIGGAAVLELLPEQIDRADGAPSGGVLELGSAMEERPAVAPLARPSDPFVRIKHGSRRAEIATATATATDEIDDGPPPMPRIVTTGWRSMIVSPPAELEGQLRDARNYATEAARSQDRTNAALYRAVSAAYDLALLARNTPESLADLLERNNIAVQQRAPMTPIIKLVFGPDYDKTRITEYAATLEHAARAGIQRGALEGLLQKTPGGIKSLVQSVRAKRLTDAGRERRVRTVPRDSIARTLRVMPRLKFDEIAPQGDEFALVLIRRSPNAGVEIIAEVPRNVSLIEKAASEVLRDPD